MIKVGDLVVSKGIVGMGDAVDEKVVGLVLDVFEDDGCIEYYEIQWPHEIGWFEPRQLNLVSIIRSDA